MKNKIVNKLTEYAYHTAVCLWSGLIIGAGIAIGFSTALAMLLKL